MTPTGVESLAPSFPGLSRRLACMVYEGMLLFGVLFTATYLYSSLTQQRHALIGKHGLQVFLLLVLGIYFTWFWSRGGQTVAMKAWNLRIVDIYGNALSQRRALWRFLWSWLWLLPALLSIRFADLHSLTQIAATFVAGIVAYSGLAQLHSRRQMLHDVICGTQMVNAEVNAVTGAKSEV